jgi:nucleoside-diphosphate kinase
MEETLVLIKPDAIQRGLVGEILRRFERKGLKVIGLKMLRLKEAVLREHYAHVVDKPFFEELSTFMSSSPVVAVALQGIGAIETVRRISGTSPDDLGSIRGDFSVSNQKNMVHSSDSVETAKREIARFFESQELFEYDKDEWKYIFADSDR